MEPTIPGQPSLQMSPDALRRQAELIAASKTPSGILRKPLEGEQLLTNANEALEKQSRLMSMKENQDAKNIETQSELAKIGLAPPPVQAIPVSSQAISDEQVVSRQAPVVPQEMMGQQVPGQAQPSSYEQLIQQGVSLQDAASQKALDASDQIMKQYEQSQARLQQARFEAENDLKSKISEIESKQKDFTWDNRSLWEKSSTGQKVFLAIAGFLSSMSPQGAKTFQDTIADSMTRDLNQQKEKYNLLKEQKRDYQSLYGDLVKKFGDQDMASLQLMNMQLGAVNNRLKILSENAQSKTVAAKALQGVELVNSEIAKNQAQMLNIATAKRGDVIPGYVNTIPDKTARDKFLQNVASKKTLDATLNELETLTKGTGEAIPFTTKNIRAKQLVQDAQLQMKEIKKLGVLSGDDAKRLEDYISAPSVFKSDAVMLQQIKGMKDLANKALKAQEAVYGLTPAGSNIGRIK